jgi:hypothetical protein
MVFSLSSSCMFSSCSFLVYLALILMLMVKYIQIKAFFFLCLIHTFTTTCTFRSGCNCNSNKHVFIAKNAIIVKHFHEKLCKESIVSCNPAVVENPVVMTCPEIRRFWNGIFITISAEGLIYLNHSKQNNINPL